MPREPSRTLTVVPPTDFVTRATETTLRSPLRTGRRPGRHTGQLPQTRTSENPVLLDEMLTRATAVLGSREEALAWLQRPSANFSNESPQELIRDPKNISRINDMLTCIEYGVYT